MADLYTTKTAALKATKADFNKLETKKLKVNGKDVATSVKHPDDTREIITENDLWGSWAEIKNGEIIFHDDSIIVPTDEEYVANSSISGETIYVRWNGSVTKIEENKAYIGDNFYCNIETNKIINGSSNTYAAIEKPTVPTSRLYGIFLGNTNLSSFKGDLSSLIDGSYMFYECAALSTFEGDLSSLIDGSYMFYECAVLTTFTSDLSSITNSKEMFQYCENLTTFTSDLSSLTNGYHMFYECENLTSFTSDLSSLTNGFGMFTHCKLDTDSIIHIAETIKDVRDLTNGGGNWDDIWKTIHIGIGSTTLTEEEKELLTEIHNKGWQVYVGCDGGDSSEFNPAALIPIDGEEVTTPIPYWAKPQETDEEHAEYTDGNGKFYIILGGNYIFVDDPETYGLFTSLEDAAANMRLTKIEKTTNQN